MYTCLISYPRQGTDWIMKCFGHEKTENGRFGYYREYFNLIVNRRRSAIFRTFHMGTEINPDDIFKELTKDQFSKLLNKSWKSDKIYMTKENFSFSKIPCFCDEFNCFVMYRHRKFTFPTSREDYVNGIYESFLNNVYSKKEFNDLREFCKPQMFKNRLVISHIIAFTFVFYYAQENNLPIINYEDLITNTNTQLEKKLEQIKEWKYKHTKSKAIKEILNTRMSVKDLRYRESRYNYLECEDECRKVIEFIKNLNILNEEYINLLS